MSHTCNLSPPKAEEELFHEFEASLGYREKPCLAFVKGTEKSVLPMIGTRYLEGFCAVFLGSCFVLRHSAALNDFQFLKTIKNKNNSGTPTEPIPRTPIVRRMRREEAYFILGSRATVHSQNQTHSSSSVCQFPQSQSGPLKEERGFPGKYEEVKRGLRLSQPSFIRYPRAPRDLPQSP